MTIKEVFGMEGPVARVGSLLYDMIFVNILWLLFGGPALVLLLKMIPVIYSPVVQTILWVIVIAAMLHMGPATTAVFSALGKKARKEESYTFRDFWRSYKQNYKQGILITLAMGAVVGIILYAVWLEFMNRELFGSMIYVLLPVQGFVLLELVFITTYMYALLARFEMKTKDVFKYAFMMSNKHIFTTLLCVLILLAISAATFLWNLGVGLFGFGVYFYAAVILLERVFRNYMPEEEKDEKESLEAGTSEDSSKDLTGIETEDRKDGMDRPAKGNRTEGGRSGETLDRERQAILDRYTGKSPEPSEKKKKK